MSRGARCVGAGFVALATLCAGAAAGEQAYLIGGGDNLQVTIPVTVMGLMSANFVRDILVPELNRAIRLGWVQLPTRSDKG